jgi:hypothetical protein
LYRYIIVLIPGKGKPSQSGKDQLEGRIGDIEGKFLLSLLGAHTLVAGGRMV